MRYSGKQIRVTLKDGHEMVYRGSAYTLLIKTKYDGDFEDTVFVYLHGKIWNWWPSAAVIEVSEGQFDSEEI